MVTLQQFLTECNHEEALSQIRKDRQAAFYATQVFRKIIANGSSAIYEAQLGIGDAEREADKLRQKADAVVAAAHAHYQATLMEVQEAPHRLQEATSVQAQCESLLAAINNPRVQKLMAVQAELNRLERSKRENRRHP